MCPQVTVAMNLINSHAKGNIVDPEDWSPQRTQYIDSLAAGETATLSWRINAIIDGDYMLYMVAIPKPSGPEATSAVTSCSAIHMTVKPATKLNPRGVLVYVIGTPALLGFGMFYMYRRRRRSSDAGVIASE